MKCVRFQLQISDGRLEARDVIHSVDARAPIPTALEGGDGKGPLWLCILDENKVDSLMESLVLNTVRIYDRIVMIQEEIEDSLYKPTNLVQWRLGKDPEIVEPTAKRERVDSCNIC